MSRAAQEIPRSKDATNRAARARALAAVAALEVEPTGVVNYSAGDRVVVIGADGEAVRVAQGLPAPLRPVVLLLDGAAPAPLGPEVLRARRSDAALTGWLGAFRLELPSLAPDEARFDRVLDLLAEPLIGAELPPPGYYPTRAAPDALTTALADLPETVGEFEKPQYFAYDPDLCAHGMKGTEACRRCIDACPAEAITSLAERVEVNPYLCQGGGVCAAACPSGAIRYVYPSLADSLERVRRLLDAYREAGGADPLLLVSDTRTEGTGLGVLGDDTDVLPGHMLPFLVEEVASLGLDFWFSALAYGARGVGLLDSPSMPAKSRAEIGNQLGYAREILRGLGYPANALRWVPVDRAPADWSPLMPPLEPARHAAVGDKRQGFFLAVDHLYAQAARPRRLVDLPAGAPFGAAAVDPKACTLCLSCVTVCPGRALQDGQDRPQLSFLEANCLQCGLCTRVCPEDAIWISPRLLFDAQARNQLRVLQAEAPFHCIQCGKPFATASVIARMDERLVGHWMFKAERERRRLRMCGDCRVADRMREELEST